MATYKVERILDKQIKDGDLLYKIKWAGWPEEESTWEPLDNLKNILYMVNDFEAKLIGSKGSPNTQSDEDDRSPVRNTNLSRKK
jgi:chromobox protein 1/chromobox protein 3